MAMLIALIAVLVGAAVFIVSDPPLWAIGAWLMVCGMYLSIASKV